MTRPGAAVPVVLAGSKEKRPGRMTSNGPRRGWQRPTPSVTWMVWPKGCVCQAVPCAGREGDAGKPQTR